MKRCRGCNRIKCLDEFYKNKVAKDGHRARCKQCLHDWYVAQKDHQRAKFVEKQFGVTASFIEKEKVQQKNKCLICLRERPLEVDHSHTTGKYRGMLCGSCNKGIGLFDDSPWFLQMAADYLEERGC